MHEIKYHVISAQASSVKIYDSCMIEKSSTAYVYPDRIAALDFTKGILVLCMVLYHNLNYLGYGRVTYDYLTFVPTSFIMIAGFIVTNVYAHKYSAVSREFINRLTVRAIKLLLIFTCLNILAQLIYYIKYISIDKIITRFLSEWPAIYIYGGAKVAAFEVLVPISILLFISIPLSKYQVKCPYIIHGSAIVIIAICILGENYGYSSYNMNMISSGIIGMTIGLTKSEKLKEAAKSWPYLILLYLLYWLSVYFFGDAYYKQIFATIATLVIIYALGSTLDPQRWIVRQAVLLGQYSLMSYIVQIILLQILFRINPYKLDKSYLIFLLIFLVVSIFTWCVIILAHHARNKGRLVDRMYRLIFA